MNCARYESASTLAAAASKPTLHSQLPRELRWRKGKLYSNEGKTGVTADRDKIEFRVILKTCLVFLR